VALDRAMHGAEADASAGKLRRGVKPLERHEQLVRVRRVEPGAIVANDERAVADRERDPRVVALRGELPRVAEEVL